MLTGDQIAAGRRLAGIRSQADLAMAAGVSRPTVERAEAARGLIPSMNSEAMARIVKALEAAGVEFTLDIGSSLAGGLGMRRRAPPDRVGGTDGGFDADRHNEAPVSHESLERNTL